MSHSNHSLDSEWNIQTSETTANSSYHRIDGPNTVAETTSTVICYSGASPNRTEIYTFSPYRTLCSWYLERNSLGWQVTNVNVCRGDSGAQVFASNRAYGIVSRGINPISVNCFSQMWYVQMQAQLNDMFGMTMSGPNTVRLKFSHSALCINAVGSAYTNPTVLTQNSCNLTSGRWWRLLPVNGVNSDEYYIKRRDGSSLDCITLDSPFSAGSAVVQRPCFNGLNQRWVIVRRSAEYFSLVSSQSGVCVDVPGSSTAAGVALIGWSCTSNPNQSVMVA